MSSTLELLKEGCLNCKNGFTWWDFTWASQSLGIGPFSKVQRGSILRFRESHDLRVIPSWKVTWENSKLLHIGILSPRTQAGTRTHPQPRPLLWQRCQSWWCCGNIKKTGSNLVLLGTKLICMQLQLHTQKKIILQKESSQLRLAVCDKNWFRRHYECMLIVQI